VSDIIRAEGKKIQKWLKEHGVRVALRTIGWTLCLAVVIPFFYLGREHWQASVDKIGAYLPGKMSTATANEIMLFVPIVLFSYAMGGRVLATLLHIRTDSSPWEKAIAAAIIISFGAMCTYLLGIGA
jgi:hypothetical protein